MVSAQVLAERDGARLRQDLAAADGGRVQSLDKCLLGEIHVWSKGSQTFLTLDNHQNY